MKLFTTRIGRLAFLFGNVIIFVGFSALNEVTTIVEIILSCFLILVMFSVLIRRLHDIGKSGWWSLLIFIPIVNIVFMLVLLFKPGDQEENKYGAVGKGLLPS